MRAQIQACKTDQRHDGAADQVWPHAAAAGQFARDQQREKPKPIVAMVTATDGKPKPLLAAGGRTTCTVAPSNWVSARPNASAMTQWATAIQRRRQAR